MTKKHILKKHILIRMFRRIGDIKYFLKRRIRIMFDVSTNNVQQLRWWTAARIKERRKADVEEFIKNVADPLAKQMRKKDTGKTYTEMFRYGRDVFVRQEVEKRLKDDPIRDYYYFYLLTSFAMPRINPNYFIKNQKRYRNGLMITSNYNKLDKFVHNEDKRNYGRNLLFQSLGINLILKRNKNTDRSCEYRFVYDILPPQELRVRAKNKMFYIGNYLVHDTEDSEWVEGDEGRMREKEPHRRRETLALSPNRIKIYPPMLYFDDMPKDTVNIFPRMELTLDKSELSKFFRKCGVSLVTADFALGNFYRGRDDYHGRVYDAEQLRESKIEAIKGYEKKWWLWWD